MISDQWNDTRTFRKTSTPTPGAMSCHQQPKPSNRPDAAARRMMAIENETEDFTIERTSVTVANRIKTLRAQKEMTQKDLAQRANVKLDVIRDLENGKAQPDNRVLARLEQILGGQIRDRPAKKK